ncbi:hypothetical protein, partial [Kistimonas scapharcae]|uniref:hypothetical protein n=1 Tax=Kistimonas scapharcae TaxID=1036133 RepID=UPI0031EC51EB
DVAEKMVKGATENIINGAGVYELAIQMQDTTFGPGFVNRRSREFFANDKMVEELTEAGFMETDVSKMMFNYIASSSKRAEFERTFGGYQTLENARDLVNLEQAIEHEMARIDKRRQQGLDYSNATLNQLKNEFKRINDLTYKMFARNIVGIDERLLPGLVRKWRESVNDSVSQAQRNEAKQAYNAEVDTLDMATKTAWFEATDYLKEYQQTPVVGMFQKLKEYQYIRVRKDRVEFYTPYGGLTDLLEALGEQGSYAPERAKTIVRGYLGQLGTQMPPDVHSAMSNMMAYQSVLILAFSTLSSLPDIAGGVLRNRDAKGMWKAANDMRQAMM